MGTRGRLRVRVAARVALAAVLVLGVAAGCDAGSRAAVGHPTAAISGSEATGQPLEWQRVDLPSRVEPVTLTALTDGVLVGGYSSARPNPRLFTLRAGMLSAVTLEPTSPYAFEARWLSVAVHGEDVVAVGGARGGAHGNVRWTVWSGSTSRVVELPQPFGVFGGWGAGDLSGVAFAGAVPVISGAWASERTGNDISLWRLSGQRWSRRLSTGTPLASTPQTLMSARSMTSTGAGLALSGSVTDLRAGSIRSAPALWTAPGADGPWTLVRLPASGGVAEAHAARCQQSVCLVVGEDDGRLGVWQVGDGAATSLAPPPIVVGPKVSLPPPVSLAGAEALAVPGWLLVRGARGWVKRPGPQGTPTAAAAVGDAVYVVTTDTTGAPRLWVSRP